MMRSLFAMQGYHAEKLRRYGFVSPLTLTGKRRPSTERTMGVARMTMRCNNAGLPHLVKVEGTHDVESVVTYLDAVRPKLGKWTAAWILFGGQETSIFAFENEEDAVLIRMVL